MAFSCSSLFVVELVKLSTTAYELVHALLQATHTYPGCISLAAGQAHLMRWPGEGGPRCSCGPETSSRSRLSGIHVLNGSADPGKGPAEVASGRLRP